MKKIFTIVATVLLTAITWAQSPQKMSYQAVIRNAANALVTNQSIGLQVTILQGSVAGTEVFKEIYNPNPVTNANGLVTIEIGSGLPFLGAFSSINWANGPYFIKTETDPTGGTSYTITGTSQLLSVPYALFSANGTPGATGPQGPAGPQGPMGVPGTNGPNGSNTGDMQYWNGIAWVILPAGQPGQFLQLTSSKTPSWSGPTYPTLFTSEVLSTTQNTSIIGGVVINDGGSTITARGVCWSISSTPTVLGFHTNEGSGSGSFVSNMTGLSANKLYYVRAYATNSAGTAYGNEVSFTTLNGSGIYNVSPTIYPGVSGIEVTNLQECLLFLLDKNIFKAYQPPNHPTFDDLNQWKEMLNEEKASVLFGEGTRQLVFTFQMQQALGDNLRGVVEETTAAKLNEILKELGAFPMYMVYGSVKQADLTSAVGLTIVAYDADIADEVWLGEAIIDSEGSYRITYCEDQFRHSLSEIGGPDLFIRVYSVTGNILIQSKTVFNAPTEQILNVILP